MLCINIFIFNIKNNFKNKFYLKSILFLVSIKQKKVHKFLKFKLAKKCYFYLKLLLSLNFLNSGLIFLGISYRNYVLEIQFYIHLRMNISYLVTYHF